MKIRKGLRTLTAIGRDRSLLHVALHAAQADIWPLGKLLAAHLPDDERWRLATAMLVEHQRTTAGGDGLRSISATGDRVVVTFSSAGTIWSIPAGDEILPSMLATGRYEGPELEAVLGWVAAQPYLVKRRVAIDVGANVGTTTVPMAQRGFSVIAIEPVPETAALLRANVTANGLDSSVTSIERAVTAGADNVVMVVGTGLGTSEVSTGAERSVDRAHHQTEEVAGPNGLAQRGPSQDSAATVTVASGGLADVLAETGDAPSDVAFVWSDTQGCETDVITTASEIWEAGAPLFCELCPLVLARHGSGTAFAEAANHAFSYFAPSEELQRAGPSATLHPIHELTGFIDKMRPDASTDVLLIPAAPGTSR